jgi:hypothetical protein
VFWLVLRDNAERGMSVEVKLRSSDRLHKAPPGRTPAK